MKKLITEQELIAIANSPKQKTTLKQLLKDELEARK